MSIAALPVVTARRFSSCFGSPTRRPGRHAHAVISFQLAGELSFEQGSALEVRAGDLHVIPPGVPHRVTHARDADVWSAGLWPTRLDPARFAPLLAPLDAFARGALPRVTVPPDRRPFVAALFAELAALETRNERVRTESLLALLLAELGDHAGSARLSEGPARADVTAAALAFIGEHAFGPLSLADVAHGIGRNRSHLAETVRRDTGRSVGDWIAEIRLDEARRRLEATDEMIDVVAERVGYADATHFSRIFKRRFGRSPRAWRNANAARS